MTYAGHTFLDVHNVIVRGAPDFEPLDPSDVVDHIRAGDSPEVISMIADYLTAAREWVENEIQVSLCQRTVTLYLDCFPCWEVEWRFPPLQSIASIVYLDYSGASQTLSASLYRVDATGKPGRITPTYGELWPCTYPVTKAITITGTAGYADAASVPASAKQAIRVLTKMMFDGGGVLCDDALESVRRMLDPMRWEGYR